MTVEPKWQWYENREKNRYHDSAENFLATDSIERAELEKKRQWRDGAFSLCIHSILLIQIKQNKNNFLVSKR